MLPLLLLSSVFQLVYSLNILMYSTPVGFSHVQFTAKICETLVKNGHNVTVFFPVLEENMKKHACKGGNVVFMDMPQWIRERQKTRAAGFWQIGPLLSNLQIISQVATIQHDVCEYILENRHSLSFYNETFDVGIADINGMCAFGLFKEIKLKSKVATSAIGFMDGLSAAFHTPVTSSYVPGTLLYYYENMTFMQRMLNFIWNLTSSFSYRFIFIGRYEKFFDKHGIHFDFEKDLEEEYNYFLLNTDEFLDVARPISPRMMFIGGIAVGEPGKLPEEFNQLLSQSQKGSVVISFGSYAPTSDMPREMMDSFISAIKELKEYTFIWKTDAKALDINKGIPNLHTVNWIPQRELLNDPRVKVFISHAGMNSLLETATAGKPTIFVPIFGDQFQNAAKMTTHNSTRIIWKSDLKGDIVLGTLKEMLQDESFTIRAQRLSWLMRNKRRNAEANLLEAVEYSGKMGRLPELNVYGYKLNSIQYFSIDVIFAWLFIVFSTLFSCFKVSKFVVRRTFRKSKTE